MRILGTITNEGYSCQIKEESDGRVHYMADGDIDADGANGQNGQKPAYKADDSGSEFLANGGMIASKTWYRHPAKLMGDPAAYVDAETVPYIVVPPLIIQKTTGVVRGCKARITWKGKTVDCVVADRGPANKIGELSIAAARAVGMPSSPRSGGTEKPEILYELFPGVAAPGYLLQPA